MQIFFQVNKKQKQEDSILAPKSILRVSKIMIGPMPQIYFPAWFPYPLILLMFKDLLMSS